MDPTVRSHTRPHEAALSQESRTAPLHILGFSLLPGYPSPQHVQPPELPGTPSWPGILECCQWAPSSASVWAQDHSAPFPGNTPLVLVRCPQFSESFPQIPPPHNPSLHLRPSSESQGERKNGQNIRSFRAPPFWLPLPTLTPGLTRSLDFSQDSWAT